MNLHMYAVMKLGCEAAIYDGLGFGDNFKRHIKKRKVWFRLISQLMKSNVVLERLQWKLKLTWDFS